MKEILAELPAPKIAFDGVGGPAAAALARILPKVGTTRAAALPRPTQRVDCAPCADRYGGNRAAPWFRTGRRPRSRP
jgi:hypothetical protein